MNKNDIITLEITDISAEGSGIGRCEGLAVFVPQTAVGDRISARVLKVKKNYAFARMEELLTPSGSRIAEDCPAFNRCGGCALRHIDYRAECDIKYNRVLETMRRIGGVTLEPQTLVPSPRYERYRNKAQYPIAADGSVGFYAPRSHRIIPNNNCLLEPTEFSTVAEALKAWINQNNVSIYNEETHEGLLRHLYLRAAVVTGEIMVTLVINGGGIPNADFLVSALQSALGDRLKSVQLNINRKPTNVVLGDKNIVIFGSSTITDVLRGVKVRISPHSFYQVNHDAAELLYSIAEDYAAPDGKTVLDLYCGAGTIGLSMAHRAHEIIGVEIVPQAVEDARFNAEQNGISNARFICADAAAAAEELARTNITPDVVILDPPRKGCDEALLKIVAQDFAPQRLVYVSCDVATLARDTAILQDFGYSIEQYTPVDMFPKTTHVECVAYFTQQQ